MKTKRLTTKVPSTHQPIKKGPGWNPPFVVILVQLSYFLRISSGICESHYVFFLNSFWVRTIAIIRYIFWWSGLFFMSWFNKMPSFFASCSPSRNRPQVWYHRAYSGEYGHQTCANQELFCGRSDVCVVAIGSLFEKPRLSGLIIQGMKYYPIM